MRNIIEFFKLCLVFWPLLGIVFLIFCLYFIINHDNHINHKYNVTYSFLYTNGMMGFADSTITAKNVSSAIDQGKTYLMTNNHIMHAVLLNITELK